MQRLPPIRPLKIALITDGPMVSHYTYALAEWALSQPGIALTHIIAQELPAGATRSKWQRVKSIYADEGLKALATKMVWAFIVRFEEARLRQRGSTKHTMRRDVSALVPQTIRVRPELSKSGFVYRYGAEDMAAIRAEGFDLLLRCGSGILRGEILTAARLGILSFHHGDNRVNRGGPPAFWEVVLQQPTTGFVIQQLTDELDGGHVVFRGSFPTLRYWLANQAQLYERSNYYMQHVLSIIAETGTLPPAEEAQPYCEPLFKVPTMEVQLDYLWQFVLLKLRHLWVQRLRHQRERWGVAFVRSDWKKLVMWKGKRMANPTGRFLADPFVVARDGKHYCFVEDYSYAVRRGVISVYELGEEATPVGTALSEPFHLSFPYLFEHEGTLYMVPESAQNNDIRLYECVAFPLQWKLARVVMTDVSAVDSMIFPYQGRWWMFTNINPLGNGDHCSELSAFYADDPVKGTWLPHAMNPLIIDPERARNGGLLFDAEGIYRVAQRQGFVQYGAGATIRKIETLTQTAYEERQVSSIEPNFFKGLHGAHHLHSNGTFSVFDFVESLRLD